MLAQAKKSLSVLDDAIIDHIRKIILRDQETDIGRVQARFFFHTERMVARQTKMFAPTFRGSYTSGNGNRPMFG